MLLPFLMRRANQLRHAWWRLTRATVYGVHGVALTPSGSVVLVKLTYAPGWRVPGGAKDSGETPENGMLRELREEIGLTGWSTVEAIHSGERDEQGWVERDTLFVVRDAVYRPRRSLEVAEVREFRFDALPVDLAPIAREMIGALAGSDAHTVIEQR